MGDRNLGLTHHRGGVQGEAKNKKKHKKHFFAGGALKSYFWCIFY